MSEFSLVSVDHQPDFVDGPSLVPVDHDPFSAVGQQAQQTQPPQPQPPQPQPQSPQQLPSDMPTVAPASGGDSPSSWMGLLHGFADAMPGARYGRLAQEQFRQGNYGAATIYEAAAFGDAALGIATSGASTRLGEGVRAAETALTAAGRGVARAAESAASAVAEAIDRHHPWSMYLGGPVKQELVALPRWLHRKFHEGLDETLPKWKGGAFYASRSPDQKQQDLRYLAKYTKDFDAEYGTKIYDALLRNGFPER
jgi:hypothetical protein